MYTKTVQRYCALCNGYHQHHHHHNPDETLPALFWSSQNPPPRLAQVLGALSPRPRPFKNFDDDGGGGGGGGGDELVR